MSAPTDLYAALGVERDASADEIRKAYRKLARKYHPDVNPGNPEAEDKFKEISAAFEVLSDPERRKNYDEFGEESLRSGFDAEKARAYRSWQRGRQETGHPFEAERFHFDLNDLGDLGDLGDLFRGARGRRAPAGRRGPDVRARVELDLPTAIRGTQLEVEVPREETCDRCAGAGVEPAQATRCDACDGSGRARVARGPLDLLAACSKCGGSGSLGPACPRCGGAGVRRTSRRHKIRVPPGAEDGDTLRIAGKGGAGSAGGEPGDLVIEVAVRPHPRVRRKGRNLYLPLPVTLFEAYTGATIEVPTFDGPVALKVPSGSRPGTKLRLKGKGVERSGERGDLYVELEIAMPKPGDAELAAALERAEALYERAVREEVKL